MLIHFDTLDASFRHIFFADFRKTLAELFVGTSRRSNRRHQSEPSTFFATVFARTYDDAAADEYRLGAANCLRLVKHDRTLQQIRSHPSDGVEEEINK